MLNQRDLADRQIRAAIREYKSLGKKRFKVIKLDQPIQKGWRRFHVLAEHAVGRRDRPILEAILEVVGTVIVHHDRDFRRRRGRRRALVQIEQPLQPIRLPHWLHANYPAAWNVYFRYELLLDRNKHWQPYMVFRQPSLFELKIESNWLWYFVEIDPAIETRLSELDRWLKSRQGRQRYGWLKGVPQKNYWPEGESDRDRRLRREHERAIARAYKDFPEVDPAMSKRRVRISFWQLVFPRRSPTEEALRSDRSQCGCESCRRDHF